MIQRIEDPNYVGAIIDRLAMRMHDANMIELDMDTNTSTLNNPDTRQVLEQIIGNKLAAKLIGKTYDIAEIGRDAQMRSPRWKACVLTLLWGRFTNLSESGYPYL